VVVIVRRPLEKSKLADVVSEWRRAAGALGKRSTEARADQNLRQEKPDVAGRSR